MRTIIFTALFTLASSLPTTSHIPRAGGPAITPIPSTCTVTDALPTSPDTSNTSTTSYLPAPAALASILYSAYYPSFSSDKTQMATQCLQQCYGYGYHVECKTAYWAENVLVPAGYYGSEGGQLATACLMFNRTLSGADFVDAPRGQGEGAFAASIEC